MSPIRVRTSGFVSDTLTLQRCGWEFFVEYRADYLSTMMILRYRSNVAHTTFNCQQMVSEMQWDHMRPEAHSNYGFEFNFDFEQLVAEHVFMESNPALTTRTFYEADMEAAHAMRSPYETMERTNVGEFIETIFPRRDRGEIWVPETPTATGLLDQILDLQVDKQAEIRDTKRKARRRKERGSIILLGEEVA